MNIISLPPGGGKTTMLVSWVRQGTLLTPNYWSRVILAPSERRAEVLYREFGLHKGQVHGVHSWRSEIAPVEVEVVIDDLDAVLTTLFGRPIEMVTLTDGDRLPRRRITP